MVMMNLNGKTLWRRSLTLQLTVPNAETPRSAKFVPENLPSPTCFFFLSLSLFCETTNNRQNSHQICLFLKQVSISKTVVLQNLKCSYDDKALFLWIFFWSLQIPPTSCTRHFLFVWVQDGGATEYLSSTVFENCSTRLLRDFYMDSDFRAEWDKTLVQHRQLQVCHITGTEVGLMIKKFPMMIAREYVLAWRIWEGDEQSYYCVLKVFLIFLFVCVCDCVLLRLALYQDASLILYSNFTQQILRIESARVWSVANGKLMTIGVCGGRHVNTLMHHANPNISVQTSMFQAGVSEKVCQECMIPHSHVYICVCLYRFIFCSAEKANFFVNVNPCCQTNSQIALEIGSWRMLKWGLEMNVMHALHVV